jgi:hypothetical protein
MLDNKKEKIYPIGTLVKLTFFPYPAGYIKSHFKGAMVIQLFSGGSAMIAGMGDVEEIKSTDVK